MALKEQDIVFTGQDTSGNTVIQMPITRLENVEGLSDELLKCVRSINGITVDNTGGVSISNVASADRLSSARTISLTSDVTGSTSFDGSGNLSIATTTNHTHNYLPLTGGTITGGVAIDATNYTDDFGLNNGLVMLVKGTTPGGVVVAESTNGSAVVMGIQSSNVRGMYDEVGNGICYKSGNNYHLGPSGVYSNGSVLYGAAWNDYAEYRTQIENIEPGYCVASADDGRVYKTTEKFQACDGIVSDTFGFAIGETDKCKTPLAVAGRVLAYCEGDRHDYHAGDTVCAGPEGKICKMTREEICKRPDRIIGIVSEIPEYETWGTGNVEVNGRIWIKVK